MLFLRKGLIGMVARVLPGAGLAILVVVIACLPGHVQGTDDQTISVQLTFPVAPPPRRTTDLHDDPLPPGVIARLGSSRLRHFGLIDFFLLPDGKTVRTVGRDGFLRTWNLASGCQTGAVALEGETGKATRQREGLNGGPCVLDPLLTFSPDGKLLAAIFSQQIAIWDVDTGRELKKLERPKDRLGHAVFSPDGRKLAVVNDGGLLVLDWRNDIERRRGFPTVPNRNGENACQLQFSPDSRYLVTRQVGRSLLTVFGRDDFKPAYSVKGQVNNFAIAPDSKKLVVVKVGDEGESVHVLDLETGKEHKQIVTRDTPAPPGAWRHRFLLSPDGKTLAIGEQFEGSTRLLDPVTGKERMRFNVEGNVIDLAFSHDGAKIACSSSRTLAVVDVASGRATQFDVGGISRVVFTGDGKTLLGIDRTNHRLRVWDLVSGRERQEEPGQLVTDRRHPRSRFAVSLDGRYFASGTDNSRDSVNVWDLSDGRLVNTVKPRPNGGFSRSQLLLSPDGGTLVVNDGWILRYLDVRTGTERRTVDLTGPKVNQEQLQDMDLGKGVADHVFPDMRRAVTIIVAGRTHLLIQDLEERSQVQRTILGDVCAWAWPSVATWVPRNRGMGLAVASLTSGRLRIRIPAYHLQNGPVALSPNGQLLAAMTETFMDVEVRDVCTGRTVASLRTGWVGHLALAPDNRTMVTTGVGGLRVWDLATGKERRLVTTREPLPDQARLICEGLILTPDGRRAITAVADGTGLVWDLDSFGTEPLVKSSEDVDVAGCWADLARDDAAIAHLATCRFLQVPAGPVISFLAGKVRPGVGPDPEYVGEAIDMLGSNSFLTRERAMARLAELGPMVATELRQAVRTSEKPEIRHRASELLNKTSIEPVLKGEQLRLVRAVAILERIGTAEARKLLAEIAAGAKGARETEEAQAALERLDLVKPKR